MRAPANIASVHRQDKIKLTLVSNVLVYRDLLD
jgi:hypothetical protein